MTYRRFKGLRYWYRRFRMRKRNCWKCIHFHISEIRKSDTHCLKYGYQFPKYVAVVTLCRDWEERDR